MEQFMVSEQELVARYQKYFMNWDQFAAVRTKPNTYRTTEEGFDQALRDKRWFIPAGTPILTHPLLKNIEQPQEQYLLGRFLLQFLEYGTVLEHEFVNTTLAELALGEAGIPLPDQMRVDAFKIYTDEAYHACFNLEATQQIRNYIGLSMSDAWPLKNSRVVGLRKLIPQGKSKESFLIRFGIAAISETVAAKELSQTMKGIVIDPIYDLFVDHAEDEKKHCMYFSTLIEVVWNYLSPDEKKFLGMNFPKILKAFVDINTIALFDALNKIGIDQESAGIIIKDSYPLDFTIQRALSVAAVTFRIFDRLGVFNIPEVKEAFISEGFLTAA
jgi:hypothetical protein